MEYIRVTKENLEQEHICCAISNNKDVQVSSKKAWLAERFDEGLVFLKSVERGKCFIEYIPVENAWNPIVADNYMYIDCLWVSGSFKGHGYSNDLLDECIRDSKEKGKSGLCILSSARDSRFAMKLTTAFNSGIFLFRQMQKRPDSRSVPGIRRSQNVDMCCITPASARLMQSMFLYLKPLQRNRASRSGPFICRASLRHKTPPRPSPPTLSSAMAII